MVIRSLFYLLFFSRLLSASDGYVIGDLLGQMGNCLFQVATVSSYAWDHDLQAYFPRLSHTPQLCQHVFSRCKIFPPTDEVDLEWAQPDFCYHPIPYASKIKISGYLQSYKYFDHRRQKLLELFAPTARDEKYIQKNYLWLLEHPKTVGVQIRYYIDDVDGNIFPQYGRDFLQKAMQEFPSDALFIVSSNNIDFAKQNITDENVVYLEGEPHYIDFYLLSLCKHNIITNSTFGWWGAYLNQNPEKKIVCPLVWLNGTDTKDLCPEDWIKIDAKRGRISDPNSY